MSTAMPPDPDPADTTGLEPGGGLPPGAIPPDSGSTSGLSAPQEKPRRKITTTTVLTVAAIVILAAFFIATGISVLVGLF